jgi:hypothetical protein
MLSEQLRILPAPVVFLERLQSEKTLPVSTLKALDKVYSLDGSSNGEIRLRWYGLALPAGTEYAESAAGMCFYRVSRLVS